MSTADRLIAQGRAEGHAEGRAQGRAALLLLMLETRFGALSDDVRVRVAGVPEEEQFRWAMRVFDARTLDDVFAAG